MRKLHFYLHSILSFSQYIFNSLDRTYIPKHIILVLVWCLSISISTHSICLCEIHFAKKNYFKWNIENAIKQFMRFSNLFFRSICCIVFCSSLANDFIRPHWVVKILWWKVKFHCNLQSRIQSSINIIGFVVCLIDL